WNIHGLGPHSGRPQQRCGHYRYSDKLPHAPFHVPLLSAVPTISPTVRLRCQSNRDGPFSCHTRNIQFVHIILPSFFSGSPLVVSNHPQRPPLSGVLPSLLQLDLDPLISHLQFGHLSKSTYDHPDAVLVFHRQIPISQRKIISHRLVGTGKGSHLLQAV